MAIRAISGISFTSYDGSKNRNIKPGNTERHTSNTLKTLPVIVLFATVPAQSGNSMLPAGAYFPQVNRTEQIAQNGAQADVLVRDIVRTKDEACRFTQYNTDSIPNNAEALGFNYKVKRQDGSIGTLTGIFQAICPDKTDDGKYLVTYDPVLKNVEDSNIKTCYIPEKFGEYILKFAKSDTNNNAIDVFDKNIFEEAFGKEVISASPDIKMAIEKILPAIKKSDN